MKSYDSTVLKLLDNKQQRMEQMQQLLLDAVVSIKHPKRNYY